MKPSFANPVLILFILSLAVRSLTALPQQQPHTMDEAYYTVNAITLVRDGGFTEHFIWNYLPPPESVSHPGNLYWMPLTSIIAAAGMAAGGGGYNAGKWLMVLLSAGLPVLGFVITRQVSSNTRHAWLVGLLMLFSGFYFPVWTAIDSFTPFALLGAGCLYAGWQAVERKSWRWGAGCGLVGGLAYLTRADGLLLLVSVGMFWLWQIKINRLAVKPGAVIGGAAVIGCGLVIAPWLIRNLAVTGSLLPGGGGQTIWLTTYNDIFSYGRDLSWQTYLASGWNTIIRSKLWAAGINLQTLIAVQGMIVAFPLAIAGWWQLRQHGLFQLALLYTGLLTTAMTLVFTFPGPRGALFHSGGAILPFVFIAAATGLDALVAAAARKRGWQAASAQGVFSVALVGFGVLISLFVTARSLPGWNQTYAGYAEIANHPARQNATVMLGNPPGYLYHGGTQAIMLPTESITTTLTVADRYGATYLVLDSNSAGLPLAPYFTGTATHPRLIKEAVFEGSLVLYRIDDKR